MSSRKYKLSEEICVQCLEVIFKENGGWEEWFVNPTAGPWKMIRIEGVKDDKLCRFRKEEDRPDLIIAHRSKQLIMILEAKDNINGLIGNSGDQIGKSTKVFKTMFGRIRVILGRHGKIIYAKSKCHTQLLCGYIFPITSDLKTLEQEMQILSRYHAKECTKIGETELTPHIIFAVASDANKDLSIFYTLISAQPQLSARISELLPKTIVDIAEHKSADGKNYQSHFP